MRPNGTQTEILLVEDSQTDVLMTREALSETKTMHHLQVVGTGEDALKLLRRQEPFHGAVLPNLILLDLNLPGMSGQDVLEQIKRDDATKRIPVVVLTTSRAQEDIYRAYGLHANCYVAKPLGLDRFTDVLRRVEEFWLGLARLPPLAV